MKPFIAVALVAAASSFAMPINAQATSRHEVYAGIGTLGGTLGYGYALGTHSAIRVEGNYFDYSRSLKSSSETYRGSLKLGTIGAYYDLFFAGPFRLTGGVLLGTNSFSGDVVASSGTITINHQQYSAAGQYAHVAAKFATVSPYLGLGWGHRPERGGLGFFGDLGVAYGKPNVTLAVSNGLQQAAGSSNIAAEQSSLQHEANKLTFYPVLRVCLDYQF
jgi:hypothetical protein